MSDSKQPRPDRRDFHTLAAAALGGLLAGASLAGADDKPKEPTKKDPKKPLLLQEPHVCRGLNQCKGKGADKKNECAGQGTCASVKEHSCGGENECAGQGGCGKTPGENNCKGMGSCHVPLHAGAWEKARAAYEKAMKNPDKKFGAAPKK
jgi:hypothetical protein